MSYLCYLCLLCIVVSYMPNHHNITEILLKVALNIVNHTRLDYICKVPGPFALVHVHPGSVRPKSGFVWPDNYM